MQVTVKKPTEVEKQFMHKQPTWSCGVSEFDWYYDSEETCLLIEGDVQCPACVITVNANSDTLITAHKLKGDEA